MTESVICPRCLNVSDQKVEFEENSKCGKCGANIPFVVGHFLMIILQDLINQEAKFNQNFLPELLKIKIDPPEHSLIKDLWANIWGNRNQEIQNILYQKGQELLESKNLEIIESTKKEFGVELDSENASIIMTLMRICKNSKTDIEWVLQPLSLQVKREDGSFLISLMSWVPWEEKKRMWPIIVGEKSRIITSTENLTKPLGEHIICYPNEEQKSFVIATMTKTSRKIFIIDSKA